MNPRRIMFLIRGSFSVGISRVVIGEICKKKLLERFLNEFREDFLKTPERISE